MLKAILYVINLNLCVFFLYTLVFASFYALCSCGITTTSLDVFCSRLLYTYYTVVLVSLGVGPKIDSNTFDDLLGNHTFTSKPSKPTTLKGMKDDQLEGVLDPEELKVCT